MDFLELAKTRFASRRFTDRKVEPEKLEKILEAGRVAPTAANLQPQRILVIQSGQGLEKLSKAGSVYRAPLALVVCADHSACWKRPLDGKNTADIDASIVATHLILEATYLGLDSIWVCYFKKEIVSAEFALPAEVEPINILGIGYSDAPKKSPDRHGSERKPLAELVRYETF